MARTDYTGQLCGIYPRVSTEAQADEQKNSLDEQVLECRTYAARVGMVVDETCVEPEKYTSTTTDRPVWNKLLATMRQRGVTNLVIDRADRLTREGRATAGHLLWVLRQANITLHVALDNLVVNDDRSEGEFLDQARSARKENEQRATLLKRTKRGYARDHGRYHRGNRDPYGWRSVPVAWDKKDRPIRYQLQHDDRTYAALGFPPTPFAPTPYAARLRMLTLYQHGDSTLTIAKQLTAAGVPTSTQLAGFTMRPDKHRAPAGTWSHNVVAEIINSPLNTGDATSFRGEYEHMPPDTRHPHAWRRAKDLPREQQVELPAGTVLPMIEPAQAAAIAQRRAKNKRQRGGHVWAQYALLAGGGATCAECRGTLRITSARQRSGARYLYYSCRTHEQQPSVCPRGICVRVGVLDTLVWDAVFDRLTTTGMLTQLAEQQAALEASNDPVSELASLRERRKDLARKHGNLVESLADADDQESRRAIKDRMGRYADELAETDRHIANAERIAHDHERRRQLLASISYQVSRHLGQLIRFELARQRAMTANGEPLDMLDPQVVRLMRTILDTLGCIVTVRRREDYSLDLAVDFVLSNATAAPWFPPSPDDETDPWAFITSLLPELPDTPASRTLATMVGSSG